MGGGFGGMNLNQLMKEAKKCKQIWKKSQTELCSKGDLMQVLVE